MTITIENWTFTKIDDETFVNQNGAEISSWERREAVTELARTERALARFAGRDMTDMDTAAEYLELLDTRNGWDETIEMIDTLWPR